MGVKSTPAQCSAKGSVSISPYKNGLRIRWRHQGQRPEIYVPPSVPNLNSTAHSIKAIIEGDLQTGNYDHTLRRYRALLDWNDALRELVVEQQRQSSLSRPGKPGEEFLLPQPSGTLDVLKEFDRYLNCKGVSDEQSYYHQAKRMLELWGAFDLDYVPLLLSKEKIGNRTFNDRRNCLYKFFDWLVQKKKLPENPLADVATKRKGKVNDRRKPIKDSEAAAILDALRTDRFKPASSRFSHSQYYPLVAFMLQTGVRNGEALGLQVKEVDFERREIRIANSLSRTRKGTNMAARVLKGTKTDNVRFLPMNDYLFNLLQSLCMGKEPEVFVFTNENGNPIDDRMFQRRVFRPVLEKLKLPVRDLYSCRHTFATRAVQQGMKPHEVAYLMGDSVETVLGNYFHNNRRPNSLPVSIFESCELHKI
jgi:integrase